MWPWRCDRADEADHNPRKGFRYDRTGYEPEVAAQPSRKVPTICPASVTPAIRDRLERIAIAAHRALGCRDYSLFDFRIDENDEPKLLEACLFWTFGRPSIITKMINDGGRDGSEVSTRVWRNALDRATLQPGDVGAAQEPNVEIDLRSPLAS